MTAKKTIRFSACVSLFVLLVFSGLSADALGSLQILVNGKPGDAHDIAHQHPNPFPCNRGDPLDYCYVDAYVYGDAVGPDEATFASAFAVWNAAQPKRDWTLKDGGPLSGTLRITKFDAYDDCSSSGGVEVRAFFDRAGSDPTKWYWAQGLYDNYNVGPAPPHNAAPPAPFSEMDVDASKEYKPPLYPYQYADGHFYDKPGAFCQHEQTVFFHATAMIVEINRDLHILTAYEGFSYGFDYPCVHTPEPAAMVVWSVIIITVCIGACVQKSKTAGRASGLWEKVGFVFTGEPQGRRASRHPFSIVRKPDERETTS